MDTTMPSTCSSVTRSPKMRKQNSTMKTGALELRMSAFIAVV